MVIPKQIKSGGHIIKIIRCKEPYDISKSGDYNGWYNVIRIANDNLPESREAETLMHEIIEHINYMHQLNLVHPAICTLSECLFGIIRENKLDFVTKV